jgi:hypothetical protein
MSRILLQSQKLLTSLVKSCFDPVGHDISEVE